MRRSKRPLLVLATLSVLAVLPAISSAATVKSGVRGSVSRTSQPVCQPENPCSTPLPGVRLTFVRGAAVHSTRTDAQGRYSIHLPAGTYTVRLAGVSSSYEPRSVRVAQGRMSTLTIVVDSGIR